MFVRPTVAAQAPCSKTASRRLFNLQFQLHPQARALRHVCSSYSMPVNTDGAAEGQPVRTDGVPHQAWTGRRTRSLFGLSRASTGDTIMSPARPERKTAPVGRSRRAPASVSLKAWELFEGEVTAVKPFGVFVRRPEDGVTGLLPVGDVSHEYVSAEDLPRLFPLGSKVTALVRKVAEGKLWLTTKQLEKTPGMMVSNPADVYRKAGRRRKQIEGSWNKLRLSPKDSKPVMVQSVRENGLLVQVESLKGMHGFIPISQLSPSLANSGQLEELVGQVLKVAVLDLNEETREVKFCHKIFDWEKKVGELAEGEVTAVKLAEPSGVQLRMEDGARGLLRIDSISHDRISAEALSNLFPVGSKVKAMVGKVDGCMLSVSTRELERKRGDMLRDPRAVFEGAEETLAARKRIGYGRRQRLSSNDEKEAPIVPVMVESANERGLRVMYGGALDGIIPFKELGPSITSYNLEALVGRELQVMALTKGATPVVFSHRRASTILQRTNYFEVGDLVEGVVQSVKPCGFLIDLGGGVIALLPFRLVSRCQVKKSSNFFTWQRDDVFNALKLGDIVKAVVVQRDLRLGRLTVSTKELEYASGDMLRDPGTVAYNAEETLARIIIPPGLKVGDLVEGVVRHVGPEGARVELDGGGVGLLSHERVSLRRDVGMAQPVVRPGARIKAVVQEMPQNQDFGIMQLSTAELEPTPGDMLVFHNHQLVYHQAEEMHARMAIPPGLKAGDLVEGVVRYVLPSVACVDLEGGGVGFLPCAQMSPRPFPLWHYWGVVPWVFSYSTPRPVWEADDVMKPGARIKAVVSEVPQNRDFGIIKLSIQELERKAGDMRRDPPARVRQRGGKKWRQKEKKSRGIGGRSDTQEAKAFGNEKADGSSGV